mmetsp:Transcript_11074/g.35086  ORF Transcript_11074/g.35086 Transcript_11074/m.35086 type:complete len:443 (+) Transcript_11074:1-1329(+)
MPDELWRWYQYRWGICRKAAPNPGHRALVDLEGSFEGDFLLVTQNIDGLHKQAGSDPARLCEIHGRIDEMRCDERVQGACLHGVDLDDPANFELVRATIQLTPKPAKDEQAEFVPKCPRCGVRQRPKILWFDECYNEAIYKSMTVSQATDACDTLLIIGTQLTTGLPSRMVGAVRHSGGAIIRMDPSYDPEDSSGMLHLQAKSGDALPRIVARLRELQQEPLLAPLAAVKPVPKAAPKARNPSPSRATSRASSTTRRSPSRAAGSGTALRAAASISLGGSGAVQAPEPSTHRPRSPSVGSSAKYTCVAGFFVYGTLRPDDDSGAAWTKSFCEDMCAEAAMLPGASIYYGGSYPAVCFEQTRCAVRGVFLTPGDKDSASTLMEAKLVEADRIEGYPDLYDRAVATVHTTSGAARLAYVYHRTGRFERSVSERIGDGDWLSRRR